MWWAEAPGDFELWVLLNVRTCVPGFVSSFQADPRPLGSHGNSALINIEPVDAARQMERADDSLWQIQMELCHHTAAAEDDGFVLLWKKQSGCHGGEQNWSWPVFSLKGELIKAKQTLLRQHSDQSYIKNTTLFMLQLEFGIWLRSALLNSSDWIHFTRKKKKVFQKWIIERESSLLTFPELSATSQGLPVQSQR